MSLMPQETPFRGPRLKIAHALKEIERLAGELAAYDSVVLVPEITQRSARWVMRVPSPPPEIETVTGSVIHSLRSALDLTAVWSVRLNDQDPKGVHFPFSDTEANLNAMIKDKKFHNASTESKDLLRSLKPYKGGNKLLRGLHDLNLRDKHNDLIEIRTCAVHTKTIRAGFASFTAIGGTPIDGQCLFQVGGISGFVDPRPVPMRIDTMFAPDQPFAGSDLVFTLRNLATESSNTVDAFARLYQF